MAYIEMKNSYKRYRVGDTEIIANNNVNFEIEKGELVIILGSSGAGTGMCLSTVCIFQPLMKNNSLIIEEMMSASSSNFII